MICRNYIKVFSFPLASGWGSTTRSTIEWSEGIGYDLGSYFFGSFPKVCMGLAVSHSDHNLSKDMHSHFSLPLSSQEYPLSLPFQSQGSNVSNQLWFPYPTHTSSNCLGWSVPCSSGGTLVNTVASGMCWKTAKSQHRWCLVRSASMSLTHSGEQSLQWAKMTHALGVLCLLGSTEES